MFRYLVAIFVSLFVADAYAGAGCNVARRCGACTVTAAGDSPVAVVCTRSCRTSCGCNRCTSVARIRVRSSRSCAAVKVEVPVVLPAGPVLEDTCVDGRCPLVTSIGKAAAFVAEAVVPRHVAARVRSLRAAGCGCK